MAKSGGAESSSPERDEYSDEEEMTKEDFLKNFSGLSKGIQEEIVAQIKENKKSSTSELESVMEEVNQEVNDFYTAQDIQNQKDFQETMSDDDEEGTVKTKNEKTMGRKKRKRKRWNKKRKRKWMMIWTTFSKAQTILRKKRILKTTRKKIGLTSASLMRRVLKVRFLT